MVCVYITIILVTIRCVHSGCVCSPKTTKINVLCLHFLFQTLFQGKLQFLNKIIMEDESRVLHFTPETKQTSHEWRYKFATAKKKILYVQKIMLTILFNSEGVVYSEFMPWGTTINPESYWTLKYHIRPLKIKDWKTKWWSCISLWQHNLSFSLCTWELLQKFKWKDQLCGPIHFTALT